MIDINYVFIGLVLQLLLVIFTIISVDSKRQKNQHDDLKQLIKYEIIEKLEPKFIDINSRINQIERKISRI